MTPVRICVVGAPGLIGARHTQHVVDEKESTLACIVDPTSAGPAFAKEYGVRCYTSVDALIEDRATGVIEVDGVILATPNATRE
jgi:predicted dehydrogenase